jgi:microcystin degradation protein MlrC
MKLVIAQMKHETNTFSPVPTPLARFAGRSGVPPQGREAIDAYRGTGSAIGAFIELAEAADAEIVLPVAASAWPSGPVEDAAFEHIAGRIVDAVAAGFDAALLDLHGAMVTQSHEDGEGELLRRLRAVAPALPIGVALDMHANVYPDFAAQVTTLAGYQTYPHVDMHGTGLRAGRPVLDLLAGRAKPALAWGQRPMLPHVMRQGSDFAPNRELQARCREIEAQGALAASLWVGFPNADITQAGLSAAVLTDGDPAGARARAGSPSVSTAADRPAWAMSALGNPTHSDAASAPWASISRQRACSSRLGAKSLPWRITCGSIGRWPQASVGCARPASSARIGRPARSPVPCMSTCG